MIPMPPGWTPDDDDDDVEKLAFALNGPKDLLKLPGPIVKAIAAKVMGDLLESRKAMATTVASNMVLSVVLDRHAGMNEVVGQLSASVGPALMTMGLEAEDVRDAYVLLDDTLSRDPATIDVEAVLDATEKLVSLLAERSEGKAANVALDMLAKGELQNPEDLPPAVKKKAEQSDVAEFFEGKEEPKRDGKFFDFDEDLGW